MTFTIFILFVISYISTTNLLFIPKIFTAYLQALDNLLDILDKMIKLSFIYSFMHEADAVEKYM